MKKPVQRRVWLPSGRRVLVRIDAQAPKAQPSKERGLFADMLALLASDRFVVETEKPTVRIDVERLSLRDFHVLRDVAVRAKLIPSEPEIIPCDNCDTELRFDPASLPIADLDDRYEGEDPAEEISAALPDAVDIGGRSCKRVRMKPVTVADARPLWRQLGKNKPFQITPKLLASMGVLALEGNGASPLADLRLVARAFTDAPDASWSVVEETFLALAYPPRAIATIVCPSCETVHDMEVPWPRELEPGQYHPRRGDDAPFPTATDFEARAKRIADATFRMMNAGGLTLRIELGVPEVDSGGVPMLGSYTPESRDDGGTDFVVRVYYRTFERAFRDDTSFDWEHELDETIEHEAQHHLYYLSGHDPDGRAGARRK